MTNRAKTQLPAWEPQVLPGRRSTTPTAHLAQTTPSPGGRNDENVSWRVFLANYRSSPHGRRSGTAVNAPNARRFAGILHSHRCAVAAALNQPGADISLIILRVVDAASRSFATAWASVIIPVQPANDNDVTDRSNSPIRVCDSHPVFSSAQGIQYIGRPLGRQICRSFGLSSGGPIVPSYVI